jgi:paraquat-inducible protein A
MYDHMGKSHKNLMACHHCGLLQELPDLPIGSYASCVRCECFLQKNLPDTIQRTLALSVTGIILFIITNAYPFLALEVEGRIQAATLWSGVAYFYDHAMQALALMILFTCILIPLFQLSALVYILYPMTKNRLAPHAAYIFRIFQGFMPWSMIEVFLLGILISVIKLSKLADVVPGLALWSYLALIIVITLAFSGLNQEDVWRRLPILRNPSPPQLGIKHVICHACLFTLAWEHDEHKHHHENDMCPRCGLSMHYRKPNSLHRTTALVVAAFILYIPANLMPITITDFLGTEQSDTIMSGVLFFMFSGSWHIALIIFIASVVIPLTKLLILVYLIIAVKYKVKLSPKACTKLYQFTEVVGRWSMVDVYVVTVLVALVQLDPFAVIKAGPGVIYFATVVVITMLAAESFDPRLLWDQED